MIFEPPLTACTGHVSGGHFNPAVTIGLAVARRFDWSGVPSYIVTQLAAATAAGGVLFLVATGKGGTSAADVMATGFATNGYGTHSPGGYGLGAALLTEIVLIAGFVYVILGATDDRAPKGFAPIAIGLTLTLILLVSIPVTNTSVNPARSLGVAWFAGGAALSQFGCSSLLQSWARSSTAPATPPSPAHANTSSSTSASPTTRSPKPWTKSSPGQRKVARASPLTNPEPSRDGSPPAHAAPVGTSATLHLA